MAASKLALVAVTAAPFWVTVAFHELVIFWSPGNAYVSGHPLIAVVPVLLMVMLATKPPAHSLDLVYVTWQVPPPPVPEPAMVQVTDAVPDAPVPSVAVIVELNVPAVVGVPETRPAALIARPDGRPVAAKVSVWPAAESLARTCTLAAVPTLPDCAPGLVTVTVLPVPPPEPPRAVTTELNAGLGW